MVLEMACGGTVSCFHKSLRIVNLVLNVYGVGMIIYSLWLLKEWIIRASELPSRSYLPHPWFIYTCLAVGMVVFLSTLTGLMVFNCMGSSTLCIYIVSICSLLLVQIVVIIVVFFKMDWASQIAKYSDGHHKKFQRFVGFNLKMCCWSLIIVVVAQVNVIVLAIILWVIGTEPRSELDYSNPPTLGQSFLVLPESPLLVDLSQSN